MKTIDKLHFAATVMENVNEIHGETFMDIQIDPEAEEVTFDIASSDLRLAIHLEQLLAMSYYSEIREGKIIHTI